MIKDKVIVITGAGSGLGRELAKAFCQQGSQVIGLGRSLEKLEETKRNIEQENYACYAMDVADYAQVSDVFEQIISAYGRIDILFNNAAVYPKINFLEESAEQWAAAIAINLGGVANCVKAVLPSMIDKKYGRIFNLGSWADLGPIEKSAAYSCTKGGLHALTKAIAVDIAHYNLDIEVHEWIPGHLNTQMSEYTGMDPAVAASWAVDIASQPHASKKNCIYEQNHEWQPPKSLKQKIKAKLMFWK
ncbi:SDR family oxidoreductase [Agarilytica rhodophyticola]|uniref:SDR family oxidoreductase n=1 Tax=Agarilytica rhodophyticola TaxID=1737490 RepID=UPI000B341C44|nr:SDR family oxidoreductase [Agarilytica rhodophyticola]